MKHCDRSVRFERIGFMIKVHVAMPAEQRNHVNAEGVVSTLGVGLRARASRCIRGNCAVCTAVLEHVLALPEGEWIARGRANAASP
jgi:hypothetical protein